VCALLCYIQKLRRWGLAYKEVNIFIYILTCHNHYCREELINGVAQTKVAEQIGIRQALLFGSGFDIDGASKGPTSLGMSKTSTRASK
jgi:hypothetical protein